MARRTTSLPLALPPRPPDVLVHVWLYRALHDQIVSGRLDPGARLPSTRDLAKQLSLSRGTAVTVFEMLLAEGIVESVAGSGTRVAQALSGAGRARRATSLPGSALRRLSPAAARITPFRQHSMVSSAAFRANQPALDLFPAAEWARVAATVLRRATPSLLGGGEALGHPGLRTAISEYLAISRGVASGADRVAIVSGMQEALSILATVLVAPGAHVHLEDPGYTGAVRVMQASGARVHAVSIDEEGARVPDRRRPSAFAYLTPAHQFPLAVSMTMTRRLQWLAWARETGATLFEDDYDSEFRYAGHPVSALQGLDRDGAVVFAGSFSKVLSPALRLGYVVLPADLVDPVAAALSVIRGPASPLMQATLARFMTEGHFARHLRRMREVYAERHDALITAARRQLAGRLDVRAVNAGLQTVGLLAPGIDGATVAARAAEHGVEVVPLARYARQPLEQDGLQLGFAAVPPAEIRRGVDLLALLVT